MLDLHKEKKKKMKNTLQKNMLDFCINAKNEKTKQQRVHSKKNQKTKVGSSKLPTS
jgi:hypothetical protein